MIKTVLLATDGSIHAMQAVKLAADIAAGLHARLHIVHVLLRDAAPPVLNELVERLPVTKSLRRWVDKFSLTADRDAHAAGVAAAFIPLTAPKDLLNDIGDEILAVSRQEARDANVERVTTAVVAGDAADSILECAKAEHADLIVMGSRGLSDFKSLVMGSVSHKVTANAACGVLIAR